MLGDQQNNLSSSSSAGGGKENKTHLKRSCVKAKTFISQIKTFRCLIDQMARTWLWNQYKDEIIH